MTGRGKLLALSGALLLLGVATWGAVEAALQWSSSSAVVQTSVAPPVAHFEKGDGASNSRYVKQVTLSDNRTRFMVVAKPRLGAETTVKDVVRLVSDRPTDRLVTLKAAPITNGHVEAFTWTVKNGPTTVATVDSLQPSPAAAFALPAGATYKIDLKVTLAEGAGSSEAAASFSLVLEVP
ncbi:MAG TPA: hypothetical protein VNZ52_12735 [Candidatus Thermoplasmatota archaeon]|nr:hypothetical protein [Candidatus Thermoplasmatota archaeon]